jgi:aspartyl-tRNA(Asn)/glutamyl-tRNA(Gln) amidotransferase subunit A
VPLAGELAFLSAEQLTDLIHRRRLSPVELMQSTLDRIERLNPILNAFVQLDPERGLREAQAQAAVLAAGGDPGPLAGLPFGVKELEHALGFRTTFGSPAFADRRAGYDEVHVARLRRAGAICIGKTNAPEFGHTAFTSNELFGVTRNPWHLDRTPGGSSGGTSAAIAAGLVPLATASDGGGSIRIPASFVGAYGLKPTFGLVPVGPTDMLPWLDTACYGPLTRTVRDAALYLDQVAGVHPADPTSYPRPVRSYLVALEESLPRLRIAFEARMGCPGVQRDVLREVVQAVGVFSDLGHIVEENDSHAPVLTAHWRAMNQFQHLARMEDLVRHGRRSFGAAFAQTLDGVEAVGAHEFGEYYRDRAGFNAWLGQLFERYDLLVTPTMPLEPFAAEGPVPATVDGVSLGYAFIGFTAPFNFGGNPAATVRAGFTDSGLPVGLQIVGARHADALVLRASHAYEQARPWNGHWPPLEGTAAPD